MLTPLHQQQKQLRGMGPLAESARIDINEQVDWLFSPLTLEQSKAEDIQQYPRFIKAIGLRIDKLSSQLEKDKGYVKEILQLIEPLNEMDLDVHSLTLDLRETVFDYRWLVEEFRVSLFAQQLKTRQPVSAKRLIKRWSELNDNLQRFLPDL